MRRDQRSLCTLIACLSLAAGMLLSLPSCSPGAGARPHKAPDPSRVDAYSSGLVPSSSAIKVVLTTATGIAGEPAPVGVFRFYPRLSGRASWEDESTFAFKPDRPLARGKDYRVELDLGLLRAQAPGGPDYFSFMIRAAEQAAAVETRAPRVQGDGHILVEGSLALTQGVSDAAAEKALRASGGSISWSHDSGRLHRFTVSLAAPSSRALALSWNLGSAASRGRVDVGLPSASSFVLVGARPFGGQSASKGLELAFSRPVDTGQDLRGLVSVEGVEDLRYSVNGSTVSLYAQAWPASARLRVEKGLRDSSGGSLARTAAATVSFEWEKPQVRFLGKGNILPTSQGLVLPIETMNLSGVIVEALRVRGDKVLQFLQVEVVLFLILLQLGE